MITYKAYKAYHRKNSLYIRKLTQWLDDNPNDGKAGKIKLCIAHAKANETDILAKYPNYK